mgnify:CR=1 FL=1
MTFNWFSLAAAVVNLLILYWILQRYLFGPLLKTIMDQQEQWLQREKELQQKELEIASREEQLEHERQELEYEVRTYYEQAMKEIEAFKENEQADARKKAETVYQQIVNAAKTEADHIKREALQHIDDTIKEVVASVYNAFFRGLSNQGEFVTLLLEGRMNDIKPLLGQGRSYVFTSSHPLDDEQKSRVQHVLQEAVGVGVSSFEVNEGLILGFQLSWKAEMIEYSLAQQIRDYVKIEEAEGIGS